MSKDKVEVAVAGTSNTGKTIISEIIRKALQEHGIECTVYDDLDSEVSEATELEVIRGANVVADRTEVEIREYRRLKSCPSEVPPSGLEFFEEALCTQ